MGVIIQWFWAHIRKIIIFCVINHHIPLRIIIFVGMLKIESIRLKLLRKQSFPIYVQNVETLWFWFVISVNVGCSTPNNKIKTDWFLLSHVCDHLILLLMNMWVKTPTYRCLESVHNCMISSSILTITFIEVRYMSQYDSLTIYFF